MEHRINRSMNHYNSKIQLYVWIEAKLNIFTYLFMISNLQSQHNKHNLFKWVTSISNVLVQSGICIHVHTHTHTYNFSSFFFCFVLLKQNKKKWLKTFCISENFTFVFGSDSIHTGPNNNFQRWNTLQNREPQEHSSGGSDIKNTHRSTDARSYTFPVNYIRRGFN